MPRTPTIPDLIRKISDDPENCNPDYDLYRLYRQYGESATDVTKHINNALQDKGYEDTVSISGIWRLIERITRDMVINGFGLNGNDH